MSVLPPDASFEERLQELFVAYRGNGLMLSGTDAQLARSWAGAGVPFEVIARGIRRAAERVAWNGAPGARLRSLKACVPEVEEEIARHHTQNVGARAPAPHRPAAATACPSVPATLQPVLDALAHKQAWLAPVIHELKSGILRAPPAAGAEDAMEDWVVCRLMRALPFAQRRPLLRQALERLPAGLLSPWSKKHARRFHRRAVLWEHLGMERSA